MKYAEDATTVIKPFISRQGGSKSIKQIDPITGEIINVFVSSYEAGRQTGADPSTITKVCKGYLKTTKGYKWAYAEEEL